MYFSSSSLAENTASPAASAIESEPVDFCVAFADKAAEAKLARQKKELLDVKTEIAERLLTLDEKTKVLEKWVVKRDEIRTSVTNGLVKMYTNVEPEIAAQQLQKINVEMASEILQRLGPKQSGEVLAAMEVNFASKIVKSMMANTTKLANKTESQ